MWQGSIVGIYVTGQARAPMQWVEQAEAVAGEGLKGDRYCFGIGTFSAEAGTGREVTLIELEAVEAISRDYGINANPGDLRRNLVTRNVPLNHLVARRFRVGDAVLKGIRLCEPCAHLESLTQPKLKRALAHRGGLRAQIVTGGVIRVHDPVVPE